MENQIKYNEERSKLLDKFIQTLPNVMAPMGAVLDAVYKDGALSNKAKRLMSLAIALKSGTTNCIIAQTLLALETGASKEEILETLSVVVAMSGTTGVAESLRVLKMLDELGKL
jgi:alkylhydroperoxidase/carboxymuconolactone decarboxylase family protein YurZ